MIKIKFLQNFLKQAKEIKKKIIEGIIHLKYPMYKYIIVLY